MPLSRPHGAYPNHVISRASRGPADEPISSGGTLFMMPFMFWGVTPSPNRCPMGHWGESTPSLCLDSHISNDGDSTYPIRCGNPTLLQRPTWAGGEGKLYKIRHQLLHLAVTTDALPHGMTTRMPQCYPTWRIPRTCAIRHHVHACACSVFDYAHLSTYTNCLLLTPFVNHV